MKKDFTSISDLTREEIQQLLRDAASLRTQAKLGQRIQPALGKIAALVFEKPSLRTRVTFEVAMSQLGGSAIYLGPSDIAMGIRETVPDVARNLSRWVDCIIARVFEHKKITQLAANASVPVINALSDFEHPCQTLADLLTIIDHRGGLSDTTVCWTGDGNNVCNSLILACSMMGINLRVATPRGFEPPRQVVENGNEYAKKSGAELKFTYDPYEAARDADFIYTDVWASMGQENEAEQRRKIFRPFQLNR
ncbi:MAG: ornithine carbamoyltransferase, partial [candidate division WOR-3 bacterium]